jgi:hypothetical protein
VVRERTGTRLEERKFVDAVGRSLREGRILVLIAGDGIGEGVQSLTELVNHSATKAFSFGLVEVALYGLGNERFIVQPRVLAETEIIERRMTILNMDGAVRPLLKRSQTVQAQADPAARPVSRPGEADKRVGSREYRGIRSSPIAWLARRSGAHGGWL